MANRILTEAGWEDRVRDKVGVDSSYLPDAVLQRPDVITVAEARIIKAVPNYADLTGDDKVFLEAATVCMCAVQVIDSMAARLPSRQKGPGMEVEVEVDWKARKAALEEERQAYLGSISGADNTGIGFFGLAGPTR